MSIIERSENVESKSLKKGVQVYPMKLSQPMGATLAVLGVRGSIALVHGAVGCSSLPKIFFTRHFCDPIAIRSTAVSEITAILDGGDNSVKDAINNILPKIKPEVIGLFSTGMTSLKGDDLKRIAKTIDYPIVYADTPDFEGALESGFAKMSTAFIEQLVKPTKMINPNKVLLLPHVSLTALEVEDIKDLIADFGLEVFALPDLSESLDGHLGTNQAQICQGGIKVSEIKELASCGMVITVGASMQPVADAMKKKNPCAYHVNIAGIMGLRATDCFMEILMEYTGKEPTYKMKLWRKRHQDALLDSHFTIGRKKFLLAGEPDKCVDMAGAIEEAGGRITAIVSTTQSEILKNTSAERVLVGDLEDAQNLIREVDVLISNYHGERIAYRNEKAHILRGYPILEQIGVSLTADVLYQGGTYFLTEIANAVITEHVHKQYKIDNCETE